MANIFQRQPRETTALWLERLIDIDAPADFRADVRQLLGHEGSYFHQYLKSQFDFCSFHIYHFVATWLFKFKAKVMMDNNGHFGCFLYFYVM